MVMFLKYIFDILFITSYQNKELDNLSWLHSLQCVQNFAAAGRSTVGEKYSSSCVSVLWFYWLPSSCSPWTYKYAWAFSVD